MCVVYRDPDAPDRNHTRGSKPYLRSSHYHAARCINRIGTITKERQLHRGSAARCCGTANTAFDARGERYNPCPYPYLQHRCIVMLAPHVTPSLGVTCQMPRCNVTPATAPPKLQCRARTSQLDTCKHNATPTPTPPRCSVHVLLL